MDYNIEDIVINSQLTIKLLHYADTRLETVHPAILTNEEKIAVASFSSEKRRLEYYYTRVLWKAFGTGETIAYDAHGRPFVGSGHISISHSRNTIAIGYHTTARLGIDIEYYSPKIRLIRQKFISTDDETRLDMNSDLELTIAWSIKEAVYKMEHLPGLSFKTDIHVTLDQGSGYADVIKNNERHHYFFHYIIRDRYVITYCCVANLTGISAN